MWHANLGMGWVYVIITVAIVLIVWLIIHFTSRRRGDYGSPGQSPLDVLKQRYARGEISKEEFEKMKSDLSK